MKGLVASFLLIFTLLITSFQSMAISNHDLDKGVSHSHASHDLSLDDHHKEVSHHDSHECDNCDDCDDQDCGEKSCSRTMCGCLNYISQAQSKVIHLISRRDLSIGWRLIELYTPPSLDPSIRPPKFS